MSYKQMLSSLLICTLAVMAFRTKRQTTIINNPPLTRSKQMLNSLYSNYSVTSICLLHENYPSNNYTATYLASEE